MPGTELPAELLYFVFSFLFAVFLITVLTPLTFRYGWTDAPDTRKRHAGSVPLLGGVVMFLVVGGLALLLLPKTSSILWLLGACGLVTFVGAYDDRFTMSYKLRLLAQMLAGFVLAFGVGDTLLSFGELVPGWVVQLGILSVPMTVLGVVAVINAYNLIDGMDGLAGGLALVTFVGLFVLLNNEVSDTSEMILILMIGALAAYLLFNLHVFPNTTTKIFMGDAGSTLLGFVAVAFLVRYSQGDNAVMNPVTALWLVAVPLTDMTLTFFRRLQRGRSPFHPDRTHVHHIFLRARFSESTTLLIILGWAVFLASVGIGLEWLAAPEWLSLVLFLISALMHSFVLSHAWRIARWFNIGRQ